MKLRTMLQSRRTEDFFGTAPAEKKKLIKNFKRACKLLKILDSSVSRKLEEDAGQQLFWQELGDMDSACPPSEGVQIKVRLLYLLKKKDTGINVSLRIHVK